MKHTHTGHCQACGRQQAVANKRGVNHGLLAKHGYTVSGWGFFNGTCYGADRLPLEQDHELTDRIIVDLMAQHDKSCDMADDLNMRRTDPVKCKTGTVRANDPKTGRSSWVDVLQPYAECTEYQQREARERQAWALLQDAKQCKSHAEMLRDLIVRVHGKPLTEVKRAAVIELTNDMDLGDFTLVDVWPTGGGYRQAPSYRVKRKSDGEVLHFYRQRINQLARLAKASQGE